MRRRHLIAACTLSLMSATPLAVRSQTTQPIRLIVPFPPGGAAGGAARAGGERLARGRGRRVGVGSLASR